MDYGHELAFGVSIDPGADDVAGSLRLAQLADGAGLELLAVQDHPYQPSHLEAWTLLTVLAARTERIGVTGDVIDLQLRLPSLLAKSAASLDAISPGRVVLGVGGGATADGVAALGGVPHAGGAMVRYAEEAIGVLRAATRGGAIQLDTPRHRIRGYQPGPIPRRPIPVWVGAQRPRMLAVTGRIADGWISPLQIYVPPEAVPERQDAIDAAARDAGRDPREVRRIYNVIGAIGPYRGDQGLFATTEGWVETLSTWVTDLGFDTFIFWPLTDPLQQTALFAEEVVPGIRSRVAAARKRADG